MFIYSADVFCDDCGEAIRFSLRHFGLAPKDEDNESSFDSDEFPKGPYEESESDTPDHCAACGLFLENPLTDYGREYVIDAAITDAPLGLEGKGSDTVADWLAYYDLDYDRDPRFDRFDVCEAYYLFASLYHGGQSSKEYAILGRLDRMHFRPSAMGIDYARLNENARGIFMRLASKASRQLQS